MIYPCIFLLGNDYGATHPLEGQMTESGSWRVSAATSTNRTGETTWTNRAIIDNINNGLPASIGLLAPTTLRENHRFIPSCLSSLLPLSIEGIAGVTTENTGTDFVILENAARGL